MIYGIIIPNEVERQSDAKARIKDVIENLSPEPEAIVTNGGKGLPSYTAKLAVARWPKAVHQVIAAPVPRPADAFDYKLKRIATVQFAPKGSAGESVRNAEDVLNGIVDKLIAFIETSHTSDSVLADQIERARDDGVQTKIENLPR